MVVAGGATAKEQTVAFGQKESVSKSIKKKRKRGKRSASPCSRSAALILSPLQRQALNYHYKPESL